MANKTPYQTSTDALLRPAHHTTFFEGWSVEDGNDLDLLCAEMSRLAYAERKVVEDALDRVGFRPVVFIGIEGLTSRLNTGGTEGFVARNPNRQLTVLAFRGTESDKLEDILADAMTFEVPSQRFPGCRVHAGFADRYDRVKRRLPTPIAPESDEFLITGHSLGAALATLAAAEVRSTKLITFGSPLVGDTPFSRLFQGIEVRRWVNCCDVVARIPPSRFEEPQLKSLLSELADVESFDPQLARPIQGGIDAVASIVARVFAGFDRTIEFTHVSKPRCILENGALADGISESAFQEHQRNARRTYSQRFPGLRKVPKIQTVLGSLGNLLRLGPRPQFRTLVQTMSRLMQMNHVLSRDLADHAPINYVSAFAGRADPGTGER